MEQPRRRIILVFHLTSFFNNKYPIDKNVVGVLSRKLYHYYFIILILLVLHSIVATTSFTLAWTPPLLLNAVVVVATPTSSVPPNDAMTTMANQLPLETLSSTANSFAAAHGIQIEARNDDVSFFQCAPISLLPNAFPQSEFERAKALMPLFNVLSITTPSVFDISLVGLLLL
jgi:Eukaryotic glutathione synthase, ATP binding domain